MCDFSCDPSGPVPLNPRLCAMQSSSLSESARDTLLEDGLTEPCRFAALVSDPDWSWSELGVGTIDEQQLFRLTSTAQREASRRFRVLVSVSPEWRAAVSNRKEMEVGRERQRIADERASSTLAERLGPPKRAAQAAEPSSTSLDAAGASTPRGVTAQLQRDVTFEGVPDAAEREEARGRSIWTKKVAELLVDLDLPASRLARLTPDPLLFLARSCGRMRTSTLQERVRYWRKYASWQAAHQRAALPTVIEDVLAYSECLVKQGACASALDHFLLSLRFIKSVAGIERVQACGRMDLVKRQLEAMKVEVHHRTTSRGPAPRPTVGHLVSLERAVVSMEIPVVLRCHAWWQLLCCWGGPPPQRPQRDLTRGFGAAQRISCGPGHRDKDHGTRQAARIAACLCFQRSFPPRDLVASGRLGASPEVGARAPRLPSASSGPRLAELAVAPAASCGRHGSLREVGCPSAGCVRAALVPDACSRALLEGALLPRLLAQGRCLFVAPRRLDRFPGARGGRRQA